MKIQGKNICVTGGAGFIGSHFVDEVIKEKPNSIVVIDNFYLGKKRNLVKAEKKFDNIEVIKEDAGNYKQMNEILRSNEINVVFNFAIVPLPASLINPKFCIDNNINIVLSLVELCREDAFDTLIHISSSEVYGSATYVPMDENHPRNPHTPYASSKSAGDEIIQSYVKTFNLDATIALPFNNYGPRQNEKNYAGIIPTTILRILNGLPPVIFGDGKQTRDYIYVTDVAEGICDIYKNPYTRGKIINLASGKEIEIKTLVDNICKIMDYKDDIKYGSNRAGDVKRHCASIERSKELINFEPKIDFKKGLKQTIQWYEKIYNLGEKK